MTVTITLSAPPPSTNNLYANTPRGRIKSARYRSWIAAVGWDLKLQKVEKVGGQVALDIEVERTSACADVSNRVKALEDLLVAHGVIDDDRNVMDVRVRWASIKGCKVSITPIRDVLPLDSRAA